MSGKNVFQKFTLNPCLNFAWDDGIGKEGQVENLYEFCLKIGFFPKRFLQVGAANSEENFEFMPFVEKGMETFLVEPEPDFYNTLVKRFGDIPGINIFNVGIHETAGKYKFVRAWASTCLYDLADTPKLLDIPLNEKEYETFEADCIAFDQIDDGNFDLISLDLQGGEWFCLPKMKSRPKVLSIETFGPNGYKNPKLIEIYAWCLCNCYQLGAYNESDSVFIRIKKMTI